jgi:FtsP/CotA-like multicopper oxidase with cupredoxin domain
MTRLADSRRELPEVPWAGWRSAAANPSKPIAPRRWYGAKRISGSRVQNSAGIFKDVVMLGGYQETDIDFIADNPGLTLFHCHQQLHMDFGFMTLFDYV